MNGFENMFRLNIPYVRCASSIWTTELQFKPATIKYLLLI